MRSIRKRSCTGWFMNDCQGMIEIIVKVYLVLIVDGKSFDVWLCENFIL